MSVYLSMSPSRYLIGLLLTGDVIEGELEVVLVAELGRESDLDFLVEVGVFVVPGDGEEGVALELGRRRFAEDHRHRERLFLPTHELD